MPDSSSEKESGLSSGSQAQPAPSWKPVPSKLRRLLGVLMEKARTTPDAYPMTLTALVTGANQKSNRHPMMNLSSEQVEDGLAELRRIGAAAEVHGSGRVPKYRHYGYNWLGVKGAEAAVITELLLRGEQTAGDLRVRASRFEPIPDLGTLQGIIKQLMERNLVIPLTPPGRGQLFTHNLYLAEELIALKSKFAGHTGEEDPTDADDDLGASHSLASPSAPRSPSTMGASVTAAEIVALREEVAGLRSMLAEFAHRLEKLENLVTG